MSRATFFFVAKICQNVKKGVSKSPLLKIWILKKNHQISALVRCRDATHATHGVDQSLPTSKAII
jgi:hypothetical protein